MSQPKSASAKTALNGTAREPSASEQYKRIRKLRTVGKFQEAMKLAANASQQFPKDPEAHFLLGQTLTDFQRYEAGAESMKHALELEPSNHQVRLAVCQALLEAGKFQELLDLSEDWRSLPRVAAMMGATRAAAFCELEQRDRAKECASHILKSAPADMMVYRQLVGYGLATDDERVGPWLRKRVADESDWKETYKAEGWFLLAEYLHQRGEHAEAMETYKIANQVTRKTQAKQFQAAYYPEREERRLARVKEFFPTDKLNNEAAATISDDLTRPVFILGMPRSGKSLVEYAIGAHPDVSARRELPPFTALGDQLEKQTKKPMTELLGLLTPKQRASIGAKYLKAIQSPEVREKWATDTNPMNLKGTGFLWATIPGVRIVLIRRDPLDLAFANFTKFMPKFPNGNLDPYEAGHQTRIMLDLINFWGSALKDRCLVIDYEDFVREPENKTRQILELMALEWDEACRPVAKQRAVESSGVDSRERAALDDKFIGLATPYRDMLDEMIEGLGPYGEAYR